MSENIYKFILDSNVELDDYVIGTNNSDKRTYNYSFRKIFNLLNTVISTTSMVFKHAIAGSDFTSLNDGIFTTNSSIISATTQIRINKDSYNNVDVTSLMAALEDVLLTDSFSINIKNSSDESNFGTFIVTSITNNGADFYLDGAIQGSFYNGDYEDEGVYFLEPKLISEGITDIVQDLTPQLGGNLDENGKGIMINQLAKGVTVGDVVVSRDSGVGFSSYQVANASLEHSGKLGIALASTVVSANIDIFTRGVYNNPAAYVGGSAYYLDEVNGGITNDVSGFADASVIRYVGYAIDSDNLYFNPSNSWITKDATEVNDVVILQSLQQVTTKGNTTTNDIVLDDAALDILDEDGDRRARIVKDTEYGAVVTAIDTNGNRLPVTLAGGDILLASSGLFITAQGTEVGDVMVLQAQTGTTPEGIPIFQLGAVPLNLSPITETFTDNSDVLLTNSFQTIVQGALTRDFPEGNSQARYELLVENTTNQPAEIEISITANDNVPSEIFTRIIPKNSLYQVSDEDTTTASVVIGDTIELKVRETTTKGVTIKGTSEPSVLSITEYPNVRNSVQATRSLVSDTPLGTSISYNIESGSSFVLPQASLVYNANDPVEVEVNNVSGGQIVVDSAGADSIYRSGGESNLLGMSDGESLVFRCIDSTTWKVIRSYQNDRTDRIVALGDFTTNAQFVPNYQNIINETVNYGYGLAKISFSFEIGNTAVNRRTICGLYIDNVLIDNLCEIEPKDVSNNYYQSKIFDYVFTTGDHDIEVRYGKSGGGGSLARVSNVRIYIEEMKLL